MEVAHEHALGHCCLWLPHALWILFSFPCSLDPPTGCTAVESSTDNTAATVSWVTPTTNLDITQGYEVTCVSVPGNVAVGPEPFYDSSTSTTGIDGFISLVPGTTYSCYVQTETYNGDLSIPSDPSNTFTTL